MGISSLVSIVNKDLKIFRRAKLSAVIILLAPLLIVLMVGFLFNSSSLSGIVVATYSESYTDLTEDILKEFEKQNFTINKYGLKEECVNSVKLSKTQICIIFPNDLSETGSSEDIIFYVDNSRINLAYTLLNNIENKISIKASNLGSVMAQNLINNLESIQNNLPKQKSDISISIDNLNEINEKTNKISYIDINNALENLNNAKKLLNNSEAKDNINKAITFLNLAKTKISKDLNNIENQSEETILKLKDVSIELDLLIDSIENINVLEADKIVSPIKTKIEPISKDSDNSDLIIPTIIALIALFGGVLLSSTLVMRERKTKAYLRNFITPTFDSTFILGSYLTSLIIISIQFLFIFAGIQFILKINILDSIGSISIVLFASLSVFIFIGMFIGYMFKSEETTIFASVLTAVILMFFSNTILPIELISSKFSEFAIFNPLVASQIALKKIILFELDLYSVLPELYILSSFFLIFIALTYISRKATRKML